MKEKWTEKFKSQRVGEEYCEITSSGHDTVKTRINSKMLCLPTQDQAALNFSMERGRVLKGPLLSEELLAVMIAEEVSQFSS